MWKIWAKSTFLQQALSILGQPPEYYYLLVMPITPQHNLSISDLFQGDLQLACPPTLYFELQKIIGNPTKSMSDAAYVIEKDAALAIRLLKIVNSAFYGFPSKISSIDRAITLIGIQELQSIVLSTVAIDKFSDLPSTLISMKEFWARNLRCALIAQHIDITLGHEYVDSAFICGLLHNIGQLVFFRRIPDLAKEVSSIIQQNEHLSDVEETTIEQNIIGFDHYQTGAELAKRWKLPTVISESIRLHTYDKRVEPHHKIASIVRLADCYSKTDKNHRDNVVNNLDISTNERTKILEKVDDKFEAIFKVFFPG